MRVGGVSGRHPGAARLRRVCGGGQTRTHTDSRPEELMLELIRGAALPEPQTQVYVLGFRLDFLWSSLGLAVEVDSYRTHGSPRKFAADRRRDVRLLTERAITVMRFTDAQIGHRPFEVAATLARAVAIAAATRPRSSLP